MPINKNLPFKNGLIFSSMEERAFLSIRISNFANDVKTSLVGDWMDHGSRIWVHPIGSWQNRKVSVFVVSCLIGFFKNVVDKIEDPQSVSLPTYCIYQSLLRSAKANISVQARQCWCTSLNNVAVEEILRVYLVVGIRKKLLDQPRIQNAKKAPKFHPGGDGRL
ncbi:hypothetical protein M8C21_013629 [Ambrosia artemisiifolia]|uniref:Uncharacterized protein n=1 Tax=Ambrosia artemisiifolia TaxID=4212 RepID=A0AAD5D6B3_AMBAR|nr:hypothetical protein M8C21_013629 [Ambrosia artemisiifolia]